MGFFRRMNQSPRDEAQKAAVDAVYELLRIDNRLMDRKRFDGVEVNQTAVLVTNWGFDETEAERKQQHALKMLIDCGLIVDDYGFMRDGVVMGCIEGLVCVPLDENGGLEAITNKILNSCFAVEQEIALHAASSQAGRAMQHVT